MNDDAQQNMVGGATANERNVISGNINDGVHLNGGDGNTIIGNYIGTDVTGAGKLGNGGQGVYLMNDAHQNTVGGTAAGEANVIAYNGYNGVTVGNASIGNTILRNSIFSHTNSGIENNGGGNTEFPPPVFTNVTATSVSGITPMANLTIEIFSDDADEGRIYEGTATSDAGGGFSLNKAGGFQGPYLTATATDADGNTSEFSYPQAAVKTTAQYALTVQKSGAGTGMVTSTQPVLIACGAVCSGTFNAGTTVTLVAAPDGGSDFGGWSGACSGTQTTCTVTLDAARTVTATFNAVAGLPHLLTVTKAGNGTGTVTSSPAGIDCGFNCSESYNPLPTGGVTLTATPAAGSTFGGWSGACSGSTPTCVITSGSLNASRIDVTATFTSTDTTPPAAPGSLLATPSINALTNDNTIQVSWVAGTDAGSGLAGYSFVWDTNATTEPDNTVDTTRTSTISPALPNGTGHWFHVRTIDQAGNAGTTVHLGPFMIDTAYTPPLRNPTTLTVTSHTDSGPGSLRQAILDAIPGDVITFDPGVFPPANPTTIDLFSGLPEITMGNLTIDASNAGVILDGYYTAPGMTGIGIKSSSNTIKGMKIIRFPAHGIAIYSGAKNNTIGGDSTVGSAPHGEGNIITLNGSNGVEINGTGTDNNTVSGNLIGLDVDGTRDIRVQAVAMSPNYATDQTLFIGTRFYGVWKTADGGSTWTEVNNGLTIPDVRTVAISPGYANDGTLFAGTANGGIFKTTNGGGSWTRVDGGAINRDLTDLVITPTFAAGGQIFAAASGAGLFASTNGGETWTQRNSGLTDFEINALVMSPSYGVDRTLFVMTYSRLFKSINQGYIWTQAGTQEINGTHALAISPNFANDQTLFMTTGQYEAGRALWKSTDAGNVWSPIGGDDSWFDLYALAISPNYAVDHTLFVWNQAGYMGAYISRSTDGGSNWQRLQSGSYNALAISPAYAQDQTLFAGQDRWGVAKSNDGGSAWTEVNNALTERGNGGIGVYLSNDVQGNTIGGNSPGMRNVISHNSSYAVGIDGSNAANNIISGNYIGTDASGTAPLANGDGVLIGGGAHHNRIGGTTPGERNVISSNTFSQVQIDGGASYNSISGNYIGTDASGLRTIRQSEALPHDYGIRIESGSQFNVVGGATPGDRNVISGNRGGGVIIFGDNNIVIGNYLGTDATGTSALHYQNYGVELNVQHNKVGGASPVERNVISGNDVGIRIAGDNATDNTLSGNYIGTDAGGTIALGNTCGVSFDGNTYQNVIGGATADERNVISGNTVDGIYINGGDGNTIIGNYIGTDATGAGKLGNGGNGIVIANDAHQNVIGGTAAELGNVIANNKGNGVTVGNSGSIGNTIIRNSIYGNTSMGISNDGGGNTELSPPALTSVTATSVSGIAPMANITIEIFSDDADEGRIYEGTATSDAGGGFSLTKAGGFQGPYLTATATDADGNTSEFSAPRAVVRETTQYALTVTKAGAGRGTVTSTQPVLIACGAICSGSFNAGTFVTLSATADSGSDFGGWSDACSGAQASCTVTMDAAETVTATFNPVVTETTPPINASIVINGGAASTTSRQVTLTLSATDPSGMGWMRFSNDNKQTWSDPVSFAGAYAWNLSPGDGEKTVWVKFSDSLNNWMETANAVSVTITLSTPATVTYTLTAAKTGAGSGTIASNPSGISCGDTCSEEFNSGQSVTLTATPEAGSTFAGWSGDCSGTGTCTLAMFGNRSATATFTVVQTDTAPPTDASIVINSGAATTGSRQVTLTLSASDPSGMGQMQFSNDNKVTWYSAVPFANTASWTLAAGDGQKRVWAKFSDSLNHWMEDANAVSATITYTAPAAGVTNPTGLMVVETGAGNVTLKWNKNLEEGVTYDLFRSQTANGIFYRVNTAPIGANADSISWEGGVFKINFTDKGLKEGQTYYYKVRAFANGASSPGFSDIASAKTQMIDDYVVNVLDPTNIVSIGNAVKYYIQLLPRDKFRGTLNLSCSDLPDGLLYDFIVNGESKGPSVMGLVPPVSVVLQVSAGNATPTSEHTFQLLAQNVWPGGGSNQRGTLLTLTVLPRDGAGIHVEVEKTVLRKGEKVRIYGSILPMEEGRMVTLSLTPTGGNAQTKNVRTVPGGKFEDADWLSTLGMGAYEVIGSWTDNQSNIHTSAARTFTVEKGQPVLSCLRKTGVQTAVGIEFTILGGMTPVVPYAPLTLRVENPDGGMTDQTVTLDGDGQYSRLDTFFSKNGIWKFRVYFAGNDDYVGAESNELVVPVGVDFGRAIILGGGEASQSNTYWEVTKKLTVAAYRDFKAKGFRNDMIFYLINTPDIDINYDGKSDNVVNVSTPTVAAFLDAVTTEFVSVLNPDTPLFIYLQGHGTSDGRLRVLGTDEYLTAAEFKDAMDYLQGVGKYVGREGSVNANVVIIIEACYSGSFIAQLSGPQRVILTSAGNEPYNTDASGQISFSRRFFSKLLEGDSLKKAFDYARMVQVNMNYPAPHLDDNGDGMDNTSDGLLAANLHLNGQLTWGTKPSIGTVTLTPILENGITAPISVQVTQGDVNIEKVWVQIIAPNANILGAEDTITYPELVLTRNEAKDRYEGTLNDLRISGIYKLVIMARDINQEVSDPALSYLTVSKNAMQGDINGDESVNLADAILAMRILSGFKPEGLPLAIVSDVNGDGRIGLAEAVYILQKTAGLR